MGYRLPLKSLLYLSEAKIQRPIERSPLEDLPAFENYSTIVDQRYTMRVPYQELPKEFFHPGNVMDESEKKEKPKKEKEKKEESKPSFENYIIKTSLCIEIRQGKIYVFMPPLQYAEHYLDLVACIELAAEKANVKVVIEGYGLPHDNRITKLSVSPDPGVLEINIHPAQTWKEVLTNYDTLFEQARLCRLGSEKFNLDGKHTGTGGGNHTFPRE
jgi:uncharacterized protein (DUF2126 family)